MSTNKSTPELIYRFDQTVNGQVSDRTGNGYNGNLINNPQKISDPKLGACLKFDPALKQYIAIENMVYLSSESYESISVEVWIKTTATTDAIIASFDRNEYWRLTITNDKGAGKLGWYIMTDAGQLDVYGSMEVHDGLWHHVAAIYDKGVFAIYVDGIKDENCLTKVNGSDQQVDELGTNIVSSTGEDRYGYIGVGSEAITYAIKTGPNHYFDGEMYVLRVYHEVLSEEEILNNMANDQSAMASFRGNYPIDFNLKEEKEENVLYIYDEPSGHTLSLNITNTSPQSITLNSLSSASAPSHHFALFFKAGVLSSASMTSINLAESSDWNMALVENLDAGTVSIYFSSKNTIDLPASQSIELNLQNISADASGGSRGTQVLLKFEHLFLDGQELRPGHREQYLSIINHSGAKDIPLHVGFVGQNRVLNVNYATNSLQLRITNVLSPDPADLEKNKISLYGISGTNSDAPTKLIISFDMNEDEDWALCTPGHGAGIEINGWELDADWDVAVEGSQGISPEWILELENDAALYPGEYIDINISKIIADKPNGHANLYLRYENIPGYWDGQFIAIIEKAPLIHYNSNVGIGKTSPESQLHIKSTWPRIQLEDNSLNVDWNQWRIGINPGYGGIRIDELIDFIANTRFVVMEGGNTGIGDSDPSEKLVVGGNIIADKLIDRNDNNYYCDPSGTSNLKTIYTEKIYDKNNPDYLCNPGGSSYMSSIYINSSIYQKDETDFRLNLNGNSKFNRLDLETSNHNALNAYSNGEYPCIYSKNTGSGWDYYADAESMHYGHKSSIRSKNNVKTIDNALSMIQSLRGVRFQWKESKREDIGFIAEEVGEIIPEAVEFEKDGFAKGMSYDHVTPILVEAVKAQQKIIDELKKTVVKLAKKLEKVT